MSFSSIGLSPALPSYPTRLTLGGTAVSQWLAGLGIVGALCASPLLLAQTDSTAALTEQANYWQGMGRADLVEENWQKLLRVNPQSADAMYGMAQIELTRGNAEGARTWTDRLRTTHPEDSRIARLQQLARQPGAAASDLQRARAAAQAGRSVEAVQLYRLIFDNRPPQEPLALEYYEVLGGTPQGYDDARKGMEQLAKDRPGNLDTKLALAKLLTYREPTRREGIRQLVELAKQPAMTTRARASWRQALLWLDARTPDAGLYTDYLGGQADPAVSARLNTLTTSRATATTPPKSPAALPLGEGFKALDRGDVIAAEQRFQQALRLQPGDTEALGGLGLIRLREERFAQAQDLLQQASKGSGQKWTSALRSASYWNLIGEAAVARDRNDTRLAQTLLARAVLLDAREPVGQNALAELRLAAGDFTAAEQGYRRVLDAKPADVQALRGLITAYTRLGRVAEAQALAQKLTPEQAGDIGSVRDVQVEVARTQSRAQNDAGDTDSAQRTLENAMLMAPDNPWVRLDLANIYRRNGLMAQARGVMDGLLMSRPDMPDALYASAMLAADATDPTAGLQYLDRIPASARTRDMAQLQRRLWAQSQAQRAQALARQGQPGEARNVLAQTEAALGTDVPTELWGQLAGAYAEIGDTPRALAMSRQMLTRSASSSTGDRLLYASILLKTRQDAELAAVLRQLQASNMNAVQRTDFDSLRIAYMLRQADALREAGNLEAAYNLMAPLVAERPNDPKTLATLARLYSAARDERQALTLYRRILESNPIDLDTLISAASSASALREHGQAEGYVTTALTQAPEQSRALATAGRVYRNAGNNTRAEQYLRAAVAADLRSAGGVTMVSSQGGGAQSQSVNPFSGMTGGATGTMMPLSLIASSSPATVYPDAGGKVSSLAGLPWSASAPGVQSPPTPGFQTNSGAVSTPMRDNIARASTNPLKRSGAEMMAQPTASRYQSVAAVYSFPPPATNPSEAMPAVARVAQADVSGWNTQRRLPAPPVNAALAELRDLEAERSMTLSAGTVYRNRAGEAGLSKLSDMQIPVEARIPVGNGKVVVSATPTFLDAGTPAASYGTTSRFGAGPAAALAQAQGTGTALGAQSASGVGLSVGYEGKDVNASVGSTPLGFPVTNVVGNVAFNSALSDNVTIKTDLSRKAVTDSLLSFAGAKDNRTGETSGGVVASGGRVDLTRDDGRYGLYGYGSYHLLTGRNVATNNRLEVGGGIYTHLMRDAGSSLTVGMNLGLLHYNRDLSYYTLGQGGYFSPQRYMSLALPVDWTGRNDRLSWRINGSLGVQSLTQKDSPYFPTDTTRQDKAANASTSAMALNLTSMPFTGSYAGSTKTGLAYNLGGLVEYQLAPQLFLGGALSLNNAQNYRQATAAIYLRYMFGETTEFGRPTGGGATLRPLSSPYTPLI